MTPATYNIQALVSDNTFEQLAMQLTDGTNPINITGCTIKFTVKPTKDSTNFIFQKTTASGGGVSITNAAQGRFLIEQINEFEYPEGEYLYDIQFTFTTGKVKTYLQGTITVLYSIT
jgi:hypothetical protein